jgi:hypothetical protein
MTGQVALINPGVMGQVFKACPGHYREYLSHLGSDVSPGTVTYVQGTCAGCKANGPHPLAGDQWPAPGDKMNARVGSLGKEAHDSGDGATVFHCPFCGSGQVIARSDRTIECEYCHTCFTVQVQPIFPSFPQTIDGQPMQVPGMPGQIGGPPAAPGAPPLDPMADPGGMEQGAVPPGEDPEDGAPPDEEDDEAGGDAPPWVKGAAFRTATGALLTEDTYLKHLAIKFAGDDKDAVIERVRTEGTI